MYSSRSCLRLADAMTMQARFTAFPSHATSRHWTSSTGGASGVHSGIGAPPTETCWCRTLPTDCTGHRSAGRYENSSRSQHDPPRLAGGRARASFDPHARIRRLAGAHIDREVSWQCSRRRIGVFPREVGRSRHLGVEDLGDLTQPVSQRAGNDAGRIWHQCRPTTCHRSASSRRIERFCTSVLRW